MILGRAAHRSWNSNWVIQSKLYCRNLIDRLYSGWLLWSCLLGIDWNWDGRPEWLCLSYEKATTSWESLWNLSAKLHLRYYWKPHYPYNLYQFRLNCYLKWRQRVIWRKFKAWCWQLSVILHFQRHALLSFCPFSRISLSETTGSHFYPFRRF